MVWRSSGGIGKTVHLAVDWDHGESPPCGRPAVCLVSEAAREALLLSSDVNIRKSRENGKPEVFDQRTEATRECPSGARSRMGETNTPGKQASKFVGLRSMETICGDALGGWRTGRRERGRQRRERGADRRPGGSLQRLLRGQTHEELLAVLWDIAREGGLENRIPQVNQWGGDLGAKNFGSPSQTKTCKPAETARMPC